MSQGAATSGAIFPFESEARFDAPGEVWLSAQLVYPCPALKKKVLAYITTAIEGKVHLLVHRHRDFPFVGLQVPAGTMDPGEDPERAVLREAEEESGLKDLRVVAAVGRYEYTAPWDANRVHDRHVFHLEVTGPVEKTWSHSVTAGEADKGLVFVYEWLPLDGEIDLAGGQGDLLDQFRKSASARLHMC